MIDELMIYLAKVVAIQGAFFLFYFLLLRKKTSYSSNRIYLLATFIIAFAIPFVNLPEYVEPIQMQYDVIAFDEVEDTLGGSDSVSPQTNEQQSVNYWLIAIGFYSAISLLLLLRSIRHLINLQKLKFQSEYVEKKWFKLFRTAQVHPFSFLANIFIPKDIFGSNSYNQILEHECEHVRQRHSIDRLLIDFMVALFWFNPFIYMYRRALIEIHEYQADSAVLKKYPDPIGYQEILFSQLNSTQYSGLVSHFNFSTIKKRIVMINKQKNTSTVAYLFAVPITLVVIFAFANRVPVTAAIEPVTTAIEPEPESSAVVEIEPTTPVEAEPKPETKIEESIPVSIQDSYTPSILPVKDVKGLKVTSSYGMRKDPFDGEKKMHKGLDISVPIGTPVFATADGEVHAATTKEGGYGKYVFLNHGGKYQTKYAQLSSYSVKRGDKVKKGQQIGLTGNSGRSTAPHIHYEVIEVGVGHRNPIGFVKNYKFNIKALPVIREIPPPPPSKEDNEQERRERERQMEAQLFELMEEKQRLEEELRATELVAYEALQRQQESESAAMQEQLKAEKEMVQAEKALYLQELEAVESKRQAEENAVRLDLATRDEQPLFVLDGEIIDASETKSLDPSTISQIEVLKDKDATDRYGKKAKNGVIIIKTKKDKNKSKVKNKQKPKKDS